MIHFSKILSKKTAILILFIAAINLTYSQNDIDKRDKLLNQAFREWKSGDCEKSTLLYKEAFKISKPKYGSPYLNLAFCEYQNHNYSNAITWIRESIKIGGASKEYILNFENFSEIKTEEFFQDVFDDYDELIQEYYSSIPNLSLYLKIKELICRDHFARSSGKYLNGYSESQYQDAIQQFNIAMSNNDTITGLKLKNTILAPPEEKHRETISDLTRRVDSLNIRRLIEITQESGWQNQAWILLYRHIDSYDENNFIWNHFIPLINKEIENGTVRKNFWAVFNYVRNNSDSKGGSDLWKLDEN
ncbi:hypothetical protein [Sediminibacter sp. Hel_I_10]|uniref:hypothetical protein n=1 Tax=Sediminibacter sp. Hel_I_10 TaxID=1392490 RepID=UPI00047BD470|nr:hypothetical protein [Sediminibacter sp. Hel_I_10]